MTGCLEKTTLRVSSRFLSVGKIDLNWGSDSPVRDGIVNLQAGNRNQTRIGGYLGHPRPVESGLREQSSEAEISNKDPSRITLARRGSMSRNSAIIASAL